MPLRVFDRKVFSPLCELQDMEIKEGDSSFITCYGGDEFESEDEMLKSGWTVRNDKTYCPACSKNKIWIIYDE